MPQTKWCFSIRKFELLPTLFVKEFSEKKKQKFWRIKEINSMHACAFYKIRLWQESLFLKKIYFYPKHVNVTSDSLSPLSVLNHCGTIIIGYFSSIHKVIFYFSFECIFIFRFFCCCCCFFFYQLKLQTKILYFVAFDCSSSTSKVFLYKF